MKVAIFRPFAKRRLSTALRLRLGT